MVEDDEAYFHALTRALRQADRGQPQLVVDLERVDRNLDRVLGMLGSRALRIAVKSLPCPRLVGRLMRRAGTGRLMLFDAGMLRQCVAEFPDADILLGKPLPTAALEWSLDRQSGPAAGAMSSVRWLVDGQERVNACAEVARRRGTMLRIAVELDVGMHRGGLVGPGDLDAVMDVIASQPGRLQFAGFMGYDAHAVRAPWPRTASAALASATARYQAFVLRARERWPTLMAGDVVLNGSGSPTFAMLDAGSPIDEVALGSVLVKPTDFDLPGLEAMEPAAWIAAPVIKALPGVTFPFLEPLAPLLGRRRRSLFIYGGRWMGRPAWPSGMRESRLYGLSSNQQFMSVPDRAGVRVDDYVYFRPTQSEAVLDQFGSVTVVAAGRVVRWHTFDRCGDRDGE